MTTAIPYKQLDVGDELVNFFLESTLGSISIPDIVEGKWSIIVTCGGAYDPVTTTDLGILVNSTTNLHARIILIAHLFAIRQS